MEKSSSIPKIIHFVWIGTKPKSELILKCIESWKKFCPDYEIKEWGNDAAEKISNRYMQEALAAKKYAFVSDYLRLICTTTWHIFASCNYTVNFNLRIKLFNYAHNT